ncbi:MAG: HAMP domain-containing protein [Xanthomonadaceae bacterium]|nr:HAMP domain-containing protein [Xanthomonadaceae bacterium]MDE1961175.1 HAMP domain-containing protein [Xanthomonadaceae bacterium]MDE2083478.1 HAMP domain-containing protein [Xanthomonadaceae bacterium]
MSLRFKLLLIALSTLALPLAGWLFVRQMEQLLRQGQEQTLIATANALAQSLDALGAPLPPSGSALYVHHAPGRMVVDGYGDDWTLLAPFAQNLGPSNDPGKLTLLLCDDDAWLYLYARVRDATRDRVDANDPRAQIADHLTLTLQRGALVRRYLIASAAPGHFDALTLGDASDNALPTIVEGVWQEDGSGYRVELRLPRAQMPDRLGLSVFDSAAPTPDSSDTLPLLRLSKILSTQLARIVPDGMRVRLLSDEGWVLGAAGRLADTASARGARRRWLEGFVYRSLIAPQVGQAADFAPSLPRLDATEVWQALSGVVATAWHRGSGSGDVVLAAAVPIEANGEVRGALLLERTSATLPLLTNGALLSLGGASLLALVAAGGVLFAFASVLSLRIRRLRNAAERAVRAGGRSDAPLPLTDSRDELGDLARSFSRLLEESAAYTDYLRTLASKLSHELHTPLAIVKSSLDNLEHHSLPADARPYVARARDGIERLGAIVRTMSQTSRMERAIAAAEPEDFDLAAVVRGCVDSYRPLLAPRRLDTDLPYEPLPMHGAPELIAQALDKLVDNARSFAPENGWINIALHATQDSARIAVANSGPPLPPAMQDRLFDSLVSVRETGARGDAPHLGFGLFVVRLIAQAHRGNASARNLDDGSGVEFVLELRGMPRRPLAGA